jgi:hypothetical protein
MLEKSKQRRLEKNIVNQHLTNCQLKSVILLKNSDSKRSKQMLDNSFPRKKSTTRSNEHLISFNVSYVIE